MDKLVFSFKDKYVDIAVTSRSFNRTKIKKALLYTPEASDMSGNVQYDNLDNITQLKRLLRKNRIRTKKANVVLSFDGIITRLIEVPFMKKKELKKYINNNIDEYFTVNMSEYYFDYKILGKEIEDKKKKKFSILLAAIPQNRLRDIIGFMRTSGITPQIITIYPDSVAKLFLKKNDESIAIFDIGKEKSNITILDKGRTFLHSMVSYEVHEEEEDYSELLENMGYFLNFFSTRHFGNRVDSICLIGEFYDNADLTRRIEEQFDIKVIQGLKESGVKASTVDDIDINNYADILGLSIKEKVIYNKLIDFKDAIEGSKLDRNKVILTSVAASALTITILWPLFTFAYINWNIKKYNMDEVNRKIQELSSVEQTLGELNQEKEKYKSKVAFIDVIRKDEFAFISLLEKISKGLPSFAYVTSLTMDNQNINVSFSIDNNTLDVPRIVVAINQMGIFEVIQIKEIKLDDTVTEASFALKIKNP
jgi:type IV pilus assembly protein PilM